mmetsp:Transcript_22350/g.48094  ORF Transcript_22350/g.48094 Transcript_22350/m.48094 type:complete len:246 (+) Transcript_22350:262-999(+)
MVSSVSVHKPLRQRRSRANMTLSATDEFWLSPLSAVVRNDDDASDVSDDRDDSPTLIIPPAHNQLLSTDPTSTEGLNGHDHTQDDMSCDDDDVDRHATSFYGRQKLTEMKQHGGGSWLLGFARLNNAAPPPDLVRVPSGASLDSDEDSLSDDSVVSSAATKKRPRGGVCFNETVTVQPIPHSCTLTSMQRRRMYSTSVEVRQNKIRNKKEYRHDGYDWRNATEEWEMSVDVITGELVHPVHRQFG